MLDHQNPPVTDKTIFTWFTFWIFVSCLLFICVSCYTYIIYLIGLFETIGKINRYDEYNKSFRSYHLVFLLFYCFCQRISYLLWCLISTFILNQCHVNFSLLLLSVLSEYQTIFKWNFIFIIAGSINFTILLYWLKLTLNIVFIFRTVHLCCRLSDKKPVIIKQIPVEQMTKVSYKFSKLMCIHSLTHSCMLIPCLCTPPLF